MDRRKFVSGIAGNLAAIPLSGWLSPLAESQSLTGADAAPSSLASLGLNSARNLGPYASGEIGGASISDYSSITYDRVGKRMCLFGGGHSLSQETDIRTLDLETLRWSSLYATTPRSDMMVANADSDKGRWISTNQPFARHSYNLILSNERRFYILQPQGMVSDLEVASPPWGGRICWYDYDTEVWTYSQNSFKATPWYIASAACFDVALGKSLVVGTDPQASGWGFVWLYDPATDTISRILDSKLILGFSHDLVYFPPNDRYYIIQYDGRVWELRLDRHNLAASTVIPLLVTGTLPTGKNCGLAYDSINQIIGGNISKGFFFAFDPLTKVWTATQMRVEPDSIGVPDQAFHCLEFDPGSGCFIFLSDANADTTWAYRYRGVPATGMASINDLSVSLDFGGASVASFSSATAADMGEFIGEFVRQKCYLATDPAYPDWRVFFRADSDQNGNRILGVGARDEVIVEYGRSTHGTPAHRTTPYTATVKKDGATVYTYVVPKHWWCARWRWQSSQRPVVRAPSVLRRRGWIPNFGSDGFFGTKANANAVRWAGPMDAPVDRVLGAFSTGMAAGGDNPQIGHATEYGADYIITGSAASLTSLRTEAEWCGNWCTHFRDDATGAMLDVRTGIQGYKSDGGLVNDVPYVAQEIDSSFVHPEVSHMYPCAGIPWLLTDDPFYLEELQFICNWVLLFDHHPRFNNNLPGLVYEGETRAFAWGLRDQFMCAASTPASVPSWLLPQSYWRACVEDNKTQAMKYVNSKALVCSIFRCWTRTDAIASWMAAWLSTVVGTAIAQGFVDWRPVFDWSIEQQIRLNSEPGWKQWPAPYYWFPDKGTDGSQFLGLPANTRRDSTTCKSWAEAWAFYKSGSNGNSDGSGRVIDDTGWDGTTLMEIKTGASRAPGYFLHTRAALATAVTMGTKGAQACYDNLQSQLKTAMVNHYHERAQARFSIDPIKT